MVALKDMKEAQQVQKIQDRISVSRKWRTQVAEENRWETFLEELKGKYEVTLGRTPVPPIAEMFAYKDATLANLYYKDPYIAVNAKKDATIMSAYILEAGVNHLWKELKLKSDIELQITDALFVGHAWNKVGSNTKTSGSGDLLQIVEDSVYANRVSWRDMYMNIGCKNPPKDNIWIAQRIFRPTDDVKKDYPKVAKLIQGSSYPSADPSLMKRVLYKEDFNYTGIYEVWDAHERMIYTLADEVNTKFLEDPRPWPEWLDEYPFQMLSFHNIPDEPYPQSDVAPWEPQVREKIKLFTMMLNFAKRWNRQMLMKKGTMGVQELDKFEKGIEGAILQASTSGDLQTAIKMLDWGSMPPDFFLLVDRLDALIDRIRGQSAFMQGGTTKTSTRTEGELQLIKGGADARTDRKQDRIEAHCAAIASHLVMQMKNNFDVPYIAKITGKEPPEIIQAFQDQGIYDPQSKTIRFDKSMISGDYDVAIAAGSTLPLDRQTRDAKLKDVYQMSVPLASAQTIPPFLGVLVGELLKDYDIKALDVAFQQQLQSQTQSQQDQAMIQESAMAKTESETQKRKAQASNIEADTIIKSANALGKASGEIHPDMSITK